MVTHLQHSEFSMPGALVSEAEEFLTVRQAMMQKLKANLVAAQARMRRCADRKRVEHGFVVGDIVYLKMRPYRLNAFGIHTHIKL